jgi:hypothetical protein
LNSFERSEEIAVTEHLKVQQPDLVAGGARGRRH